MAPESVSLVTRPRGQVKLFPIHATARSQAAGASPPRAHVALCITTPWGATPLSLEGARQTCVPSGPSPRVSGEAGSTALS